MTNTAPRVQGQNVKNYSKTNKAAFIPERSRLVFVADAPFVYIVEDSSNCILIGPSL